MGTYPEKMTTREKILDCAINLFSEKGYTETSVRELAMAVGVKEASIYNHFPSKNAIFECILDDFTQFLQNFFNKEKIDAITKNPTAEGILSCMPLIFPEGRQEHFRKILFVILQEQHRNTTARTFITEELILGTEKVLITIIDSLKDSGILQPGINAEFWARLHSSIIYTFTSRSLLGIGYKAPGFSRLGLTTLLRDLYNMMFTMCSTNNDTL